MHALKKLMTAAALGLLTAAPALADEDEIHYSQSSHRYISYERAAKAAENAVGPGSHATDVDFEYSRFNNRAYFEVEVYDGQGREFDVVVDANTGKVIGKRRDW